MLKKLLVIVMVLIFSSVMVMAEGAPADNADKKADVKKEGKVAKAKDSQISGKIVSIDAEKVVIANKKSKKETTIKLSADTKYFNGSMGKKGAVKAEDVAATFVADKDITVYYVKDGENLNGTKVVLKKDRPAKKAAEKKADKADAPVEK